MKLIKLSEKHYIVVDDTEIKEGDYVIEDIGGVVYGPIDEDAIVENPRKITHSTQPLEDVGLNTSMGWQLGFDKIEPIYLSEVKELLGEVDVEKTANEWLLSKGLKESSIAYTPFVSGYNQALEDNKEKEYTREDMQWALYEARHRQEHSIEEIIRALQPKTEWEVEFINGKLVLKK